MKEKNHVFQMQFCHMFSRLEFKLSLTAVLLVIAVSFFELCGKVRGLDESQLYSAAYGWIGHADLLMLSAMQMFFLIFIFFIGSMPFSDSQFVDRKQKIKNMIITRCSRSSYILTGALMSFLGAFLVMFVSFLISQLLSYVIFPVQGSIWGNSPASLTPTSEITKMIYFPPLYYGHPLLYNLIQIFYISACAGIIAMLSFSLSFFIRRGRLLVVGIPAILVLIESALVPLNYAFPYYLDMGYYNLPAFMYWSFPLAVLVISGLLITIKIHVLRDELS